MRAAAILGLGSSSGNLTPFQSSPDVSWLLGLPANASEADVILVFGGDGTIHRHLSQLVRLSLPVLVVPCGSGNDFARALGLRNRRDALSAWRGFCGGSGRVRTIDLGLITPLEPAGGARESGRSRAEGGTSRIPAFFCCAGGIGLDGEIARRANRLPRWLRGHGGYAISMPGALAKFTPFSVKILPGAAEQFSASAGGDFAMVVVFANTPVYGGGMRIAPQAQLDDGQLDICVVSEVNKFKLFCLFPTIYFGRHVQLPEVRYFHAPRLRLETETPQAVYADGEYVCQSPVEVSVAPNALRVIVLPALAGS